ncbi:MAG TPA: hypothetical protein VHZ32_17090 [Rhizomicrobium sp.]|jgi:hypothetical protein|nr:hypothetical protein [Rhizomicrobium sp.]
MISKTAIATLLLLAAQSLAWAQDQAAPAPAYTHDTPVDKIAADPAAAAVLNKDLPGLLSDAQYSLFKSMSLKQLQAASSGELSQEDVDKAVADLQALPAH